MLRSKSRPTRPKSSHRGEGRRLDLPSTTSSFKPGRRDPSKRSTRGVLPNRGNPSRGKLRGDGTGRRSSRRERSAFCDQGDLSCAKSQRLTCLSVMPNSFRVVTSFARRGDRFRSWRMIEARVEGAASIVIQPKPDESDGESPDGKRLQHHSEGLHCERRSALNARLVWSNATATR